MYHLDPAGVIAACLGLTGFLHTRQAWLKAQIGLSSLVWAVHFALLGSPTTAFTQGAIGLRTWLTLACKTPRQRHGLFWFSSAFFCGICAATWQGPVSLLPTLAAINSTAAFAFGNNLNMRYLLLGSSSLWLANGLYWHSLPVIATEAIAISLNLLGIWRIKGGAA